MTRLTKTRTDTRGRSYFLWKCNDCGLEKEIRQDNKHEHKCKFVTRVLRVQKKSVKNAPVTEITVKALTDTGLRRLIKEIETQYLII